MLYFPFFTEWLNYFSFYSFFAIWHSLWTVFFSFFFPTSQPLDSISFFRLRNKMPCSSILVPQYFPFSSSFFSCFSPCEKPVNLDFIGFWKSWKKSWKIPFLFSTPLFFVFFSFFPVHQEWQFSFFYSRNPLLFQHFPLF